MNGRETLLHVCDAPPKIGARSSFLAKARCPGNFLFITLHTPKAHLGVQESGALPNGGVYCYLQFYRTHKQRILGARRTYCIPKDLQPLLSFKCLTRKADLIWPF